VKRLLETWYNLIAIEVSYKERVVLASQVAGGAEIYFEINVEERGALLLLFSCRSAKFCGVDLLKSDNEARKARELASH